MKPDRLLSALNRFSLIVAAAAMIGLVLLLVMGTMFFDDPGESYPVFAREMAWLGLPVVLVTAACQVASRVINRLGFFYVAAVVAVAPVLVIAMEAAYLTG